MVEPYMLDQEHSLHEWDAFRATSPLNDAIHRVACYVSRTLGDTLDAANQHVLEIAYRIEDARKAGENYSVWHQTALYFNNHSCPCAQCRR